MMASNTSINVGVRRFIYSLGQYRNFEPSGTQYKVVVGRGYEYLGTVYAPGSTIPYDAGGGTVYSGLAQLERDFNSGLLDPAT
jgi:hypothetical protein